MAHRARLLNRRAALFGLQANFAERGFVLGDVLVQNVGQGLGLLGTEEDALVVLDVDRVWRSLVDGSEGEEKVPEANADLNAVGVGFTIFRSVRQLDLRGLLRLHAISEYYLW